MRPSSNNLWQVLARSLAGAALCANLAGLGTPTLGAATIPLACNYALDPTNEVHSYTSEASIISVLAPDGCDWSVVNTNDWMIIKLYTNGTGTGIVRYTVFDNPDPYPRSGVLTIANLPFTVEQIAAPCTFSILPTNNVFGSGAGSGDLSVFTVAGCGWTVSNSNQWIAITSGTNGSGAGTVYYSVAANYSANDRSGTFTVGGQPFTVTQLGTACRYALSPTAKSFAFGQGTGSVSISTSANCGWVVLNTNDWITSLSATSGLANATFNYLVAANPLGLARTGVVWIADQPVTLTQAGAPCIYSVAPSSLSYTFGAQTGSVSVTTLFGCAWSVQNPNTWITLTSGSNGFGTGSLLYQLDANPGPPRSGILTVAGQSVTINQGEATPPALLTVPTNRNVLAGASTLFNATASGSGLLSYQWQFNGIGLIDGFGVSGAATPSLTLSDIQWWRAGNYAVVVSNIRGAVTSAPPAFLAVNTAPSLAAIPDQFLCPGALLALRMVSSDVDIPAQTLTYSLDSGAPAGAQVNPLTGVFTWTASQAPSTNPVTVRLTDNGNPPLSVARSFTITVLAGLATNLSLVSTGAVWSYRDTGEDLGSTWEAPTYDDSAWAGGPARLGYGRSDIATTVSYGPSSSSKYITTYFRRAFQVSDPSSYTALNLGVLRDDGAVVYLNGAEVFRDNMPTGPINYLTVAASSVSSSNKNTFFPSPPLDPALLVAGRNVLAVEIHQRSASSSAIAFDLQLSAVQNVVAPAILVQPQALSLPEKGGGSLGVIALGARPMHFQWYFQSAPLANATNPALPLTSVLLSQAGAYYVVLTNIAGRTTSAVATLTVVPPPNTAPVLSRIGDQTVLGGAVLSFSAAAYDADLPPQNLTYTLDADAPPGATIDPVSGLFAWTAPLAHLPTTNLTTIRVTDNGSPPLDAVETISIVVQPPNTPPVLAAIGSQTVNQGNLLTFAASAIDTDFPAQTLSYSLDPGAPSGARIGPASGLFSWTPTAAQGAGNYLVTIRATDNGSPPLSDFKTVSIFVTGLPTLSLVIGTTNGLPGTQVALPVTVQQFTNVSSLQMSMHWDPTAASWVGVEQTALGGMSFGTQSTNAGILTVSWDDATGQSQQLPDGTMLFAARFQVTSALGVTNRVWLNGEPTPLEAADSDLQLLPITTFPGQIIAQPSEQDMAVPRLLSSAKTPAGELLLRWTAMPGKVYQLQAATSLSTDGWTPVGDNLVANATVLSSTNPPAPGRGRFFRVLLLP